MRCPKCGHEDEIIVYASMWVSLTDDGTDPFADSTNDRDGVEYDDDSAAECPECEHAGKLKEWKVT